MQENILIKNGPHILQLRLLIGQFRLCRPYISNSLILIKFAMHDREYIAIMRPVIIGPISGKHVSQKLNSYERLMQTSLNGHGLPCHGSIFNVAKTKLLLNLARGTAW